MATAAKIDVAAKTGSKANAAMKTTPGLHARAARISRVVPTDRPAGGFSAPKIRTVGATKTDAIAFLKNVPLFANIPKQEFKTIHGMMHECSFEPGRAIIREGEPGDSFHVVTGGTVEFTTTDADGREIVLDKVAAGGFFGELSMLTGDPRSAGVRAATPVTTLSLDRRGFHNFLMDHPRAGIDMLTVVARRLSRADALLRQTLHKQHDQSHQIA
jgi:signal-transduction protein with cAMP-binding, CBS, and nucleotidyltransferase domain